MAVLFAGCGGGGTAPMVAGTGGVAQSGGAAGGLGGAGAGGVVGTGGSGSVASRVQAQADCALFISSSYCPAVIACALPGTVTLPTCVAAVQTNLDCAKVLGESPELAVCKTQLAASPCSVLIASDGSAHLPASCIGVFTIDTGAAGGSGTGRGDTSGTGGLTGAGGTIGSGGRVGTGGTIGTGGRAGTGGIGGFAVNAGPGGGAGGISTTGGRSGTAGGGAAGTGGALGTGGVAGAAGAVGTSYQGTVLATDLLGKLLIQTSSGSSFFTTSSGCYGVSAGTRVTFQNAPGSCSRNQITVNPNQSTCMVTCDGVGDSGTVTSSTNSNAFVISTLFGSKPFTAQTLCFGVLTGDTVYFTASTGACVTNTFVDTQSGQFCDVWCR
ncbi:MAG: hypothetical protein ABJA82_02785 [Myxococcales bacterium]